jgi:hypothetical protein
MSSIVSTDTCLLMLPEASGLLMVLGPAFSTVDVVASPSTPLHEGRYERICQMESTSTKRRPNTYLGCYGQRKLGRAGSVVIAHPVLFSFDDIVFYIGLRIIGVMMSKSMCSVTMPRIIRRCCMPLFVEQEQTWFVIQRLTASQLPFTFIHSASLLILHHIQPGQLEQHWMPLGGSLHRW